MEQVFKIELQRSALVGWEISVKKIGDKKSDDGRRYVGVSGTTHYSSDSPDEIVAIIRHLLNE